MNQFCLSSGNRERETERPRCLLENERKLEWQSKFRGIGETKLRVLTIAVPEMELAERVDRAVQAIARTE